MSFLNSYNCILKHILYFGPHTHLFQTQPLLVTCLVALHDPWGGVSATSLKASLATNIYPFDPEESSSRENYVLAEDQALGGGGGV